jgi:hypothetical protein
LLRRVLSLLLDWLYTREERWRLRREEPGWVPWSMLSRGERELPFESLRPLCLCTITILVAVLPIGSIALLAEGLEAFSSSFLIGESGLSGFSLYLT